MTILPKAHTFFDWHKVPWGININDDLSAKEGFPFLKNKRLKKILRAV